MRRARPGRDDGSEHRSRSRTTTATSGQFLAGLTDFGPGRSKIFPNSADGYLKVHDQGPSQADVKRVLGKALATTVKAIEAQNYQPKKAQS